MNHWNKPAHDLKHYLKVRDTDDYLRKRREIHRRYRQTPKGAKLAIAGFRKWKRKHPQARRAHDAVKYALRVGKLVRPKTCEKCGRKPRARCDGRSGLHAHHKNYREKLKVIWLLCVLPWE